MTIDSAPIISQLDVLNALESLDVSKAMGIDGIPIIGPSQLLKKNCALPLYIPIHHLFSVSLTKHVIPHEWKWKCHSITPIRKPGDMQVPSN